MGVMIYSCMFTLVLACTATAEIINQIISERESTALPCPHPHERDVIWTRERHGHRVKILEVKGDSDIRYSDYAIKMYSSLADKSLYIFKAMTSHSGKYYCNNELAGKVTVIPSGTGTITVKERTSLSLMCPSCIRGSDVFMWCREFAGTRTAIFSNSTLLTIRHVQLVDAGLYSCKGKPIIYLNVTKDEPYAQW